MSLYGVGLLRKSSTYVIKYASGFLRRPPCLKPFLTLVCCLFYILQTRTIFPLTEALLINVCALAASTKGIRVATTGEICFSFRRFISFFKSSRQSSRLLYGHIPMPKSQSTFFLSGISLRSMRIRKPIATSAFPSFNMEDMPNGTSLPPFRSVLYDCSQ